MTKMTPANISLETHTRWTTNTAEIPMNKTTTDFLNITTEILPFNVTWSVNTTEANTMNMTSHSEDFASYLSAVMYISFVLSAVLVIVGLFGNITTIFIMQRNPFKSTAHGVYMSALAVYDSMCLVILAFSKNSLSYLFGFDLNSLNVAICKISQYLFSAAKVGSSGLVVLICIERFIAVWLSIKAKVLLTRRTAVISVCCVSILAIIVGALSLPFSGLESGSCSPNAVNNILGKWVLPIIPAFHSIIPLLVLVILTPFTIAKLCIIRAKRSALGNLSNDTTVQNATMLLTIVVFYFICIILTPFVLFIIGPAVDQSGAPPPWMVVVIESLMTLKQVNYALNFCLYGLTSPEFRQVFKNTFKM